MRNVLALAVPALVLHDATEKALGANTVRRRAKSVSVVPLVVVPWLADSPTLMIDDAKPLVAVMRGLGVVVGARVKQQLCGALVEVAVQLGVLLLGTLGAPRADPGVRAMLVSTHVRTTPPWLARRRTRSPGDGA